MTKETRAKVAAVSKPTHNTYSRLFVTTAHLFHARQKCKGITIAVESNQTPKMGKNR